MLPAPGFHHLHLNSVDPDAAIDFYVRQFPSTSKTTWGGMPALASPNDVLILFEKVDRTPTIEPRSAIWHFGWHIPDIRGRMETYRKRPDLKLLPLYTEQDGEYVLISSDTYQPTSGAPGLTKAQIAEARARGDTPRGGGGFAYMQGPDNAIVAWQQLGGVLLPIHWGTFNLAFHAWDEPIRRTLAAARANNVEVVTPRVGEIVDADAPFASSAWWEAVR